MKRRKKRGRTMTKKEIERMNKATEMCVEMSVKAQEIYLKNKSEKTSSTIKDINLLLVQLSLGSPKKCSTEKLDRVLSQPNTLVAVAQVKGGIIAMATIHFYEIFTRNVGVIEDVIVDKNHRGKGLGKNLLKMLIAEAMKRGVECVELTCRPERVVAEKMYQKLGFKKRKTNYYRLIL